MGAWGAGLYENDTALDVKDEFDKLFNDGKSVQEITDGLTAEFESIMDCADEAPLFWLALADTQWKFGVLLPDVKENALRWINELKSQTADTPDGARQGKALDDLQTKLLSPLPPVKKPKKRDFTSVNGKSATSLLINWKAILLKKEDFTDGIF